MQRWPYLSLLIRPSYYTAVCPVDIRGMDMEKSIVNESPRRRIARRFGAVAMALATLLVLGACRATGGGYIGDPLDGQPVGVYDGDAEFGFDFSCEMDTTKKRPRAVITGEITYHDDPSSIYLDGALEPTLFPEIDLHGVVEPLIVPNVPSCEEAVEGLSAALFEGTYRPQDKTL